VVSPTPTPNSADLSPQTSVDVRSVTDDFEPVPQGQLALIRCESMIFFVASRRL
jgi:hypothetical protein